MKRLSLLILVVLVLGAVAALADTAWQKDPDGRVSTNTDAVLSSPDTSAIEYVEDARGLPTFKTKANTDAHAEAVAARNAISQFYLNHGDSFEVVVRVNGTDIGTVASGTVVTKAKTQGNLYVRARLMRDAVAPAEPVAAPAERMEL